MHRLRWLNVFVLSVAMGCHRGVPDDSVAASAVVLPGISVLLRDSLSLIRGRRIGLLTNQTGIDEHGVHDIDRLRDATATDAGVQLVRLFSPEHGIRGNEDRENLASGIDARTGLPIISLYARTTIAPPDSTLAGLDAIVIDLQDIGTRTWTYVGAMVYTMRAAARHHLPVIVLDRPNPLGGVAVSGPVLDSSIANSEEDAPGKPGRAYAIYPLPLRHGMTMGELARFYAASIPIPVELHVVPMRGWRRAMWFDETGLPWVRPSPNLPTLTSALVYPSLVAFEGTRLSVGRGTSDAFQRFGAPWMNARAVDSLLASRGLPGVRFVVDSFTPQQPGDAKYDGLRIPGIRITITNRDSVQSGRIGAAILWALVESGARDSLRVDSLAFDLRFGSAEARRALMNGDDPDVVMQGEAARSDALRGREESFWIYQ